MATLTCPHCGMTIGNVKRASCKHGPMQPKEK